MAGMLTLAQAYTLALFHDAMPLDMNSDERIETLKTDIRCRHLHQLKKLPVSPPDSTTTSSWPKASYFAWMAEWSQRAEKQITAAINARALFLASRKH